MNIFWSIFLFPFFNRFLKWVNFRSNLHRKFTVGSKYNKTRAPRTPIYILVDNINYENYFKVVSHSFSNQWIPSAAFFRGLTQCESHHFNRLSKETFDFDSIASFEHNEYANKRIISGKIATSLMREIRYTRGYVIACKT